MADNNVEELVVGLVSLVLIIIYHIHLAHRVIHKPESTVIGLTRNSRRDFVKMLVLKKDGILGIQTLRNLIMGNTLLATSSVTIIVSLVAVLSSASKSSSLDASAYSSLGAIIANIQTFKIIILLALLLFSVFWLTQAIRLFNHFGILMCTIAFTYNNKGVHDDTVLLSAPDLTAQHSEAALLQRKQLLHEITTDIDFNTAILNRGSLYQTIGMRFFYSAFPATFWIFGNYYLLGGTIVLVVAFSYIDYATHFYKKSSHIMKRNLQRLNHQHDGTHENHEDKEIILEINRMISRTPSFNEKKKSSDPHIATLD